MNVQISGRGIGSWVRALTPLEEMADIRPVRLKKMGHGACILLLVGGVMSFAQAQVEHQPKLSTPAAVDPNIQFLDQIAKLRGRIADLQAVTDQAAFGRKSNFSPGTNMGTGESPTIAKKGGQGDMSGMASKVEMPPPTGAMEDERNALPARGMAGVSGFSSVIPEQIGVSNIYHIGSTGFFLNHSQHITLTASQTTTLNRLKEQSILDQTLRQQSIDRRERELYALTGAEQPDTSTIEAKVS
jgi:hypothetical protein